ncbi:MAG: tetratricopeptide repeat protein [Phycisphaerales bacterium]
MMHDQGSVGRLVSVMIKSGVTAGLAGSLVLLAGCASGDARADLAGKSDQLHGLNQEQHSTSLRGSTGLTLDEIDGVESREPSAPDRLIANLIMEGQLVELTEGSAEFERAHRSLGDVLGEVMGSIEIPERADVPVLPQIAKGYVRARAAMMNDDPAQAVAIYEQLLSATPESSEMLVGLGDAQVRMGNRAQAADSYARAVALGDRTMRALVYSTMGAVADPERVIELGSRIWSMDTDPDRAGRLLGGVMLGQAFIQTGAYSAGADVMGQALGMLDGQTVRDPKYRRELVQLYTKRAEQYAAIGDAWMVLGEGARASELYALSRGLVEREPLELIARRVASDVLDGRSGRAAMSLLDWVDQHPGTSSAALSKLVRIMSTHEIVGDEIEAELRARVDDSSVARSQRVSVLGLVLSVIEERAIQERKSTDDLQEDSVELLSGVDAELLTPVACARVLSLFGDVQGQVEASRKILERSPSAAIGLIPALVRLDGRPAEMLGLIDGDTETDRLMRVMIGVSIERPDLVGGLVGGLDWDKDRTLDSTIPTISIIAHARLAALGARWAEADRLFAECKDRTRADSMMSHDFAFYVDSLVAANRGGDAMQEAAQRIAGNGGAGSGLESGDHADLMTAGRVAIQTGDFETALDALTRAVDIDPYDEAVYEQLITLRGSRGALADGDELRRITRSLGQRLPGSALVQLIRANELAGGGARDENGQGDGTDGGSGLALLAQSEQVLAEAHLEHPWREIGIDLLLSIWLTQDRLGDARVVDRGLAWLDGQVAVMPGSVDLVGAYARLMVADGQGDRAEGVLGELVERMPSRRAGQLHEGLIRSDESRAGEADDLALSRLAGLKSVGDGLERLERASSSGRLVEFDAGMYVPSDGTGAGAGGWAYTNGQAIRVVRILGATAQASTDQAVNDLVLAITERARLVSNVVEVEVEGAGEGVIDPIAAFDQIELVSVPSSSRFAMDAYEERVRGLMDAEGNDARLTMAVQALLRSRGAGDALELFGRLAIEADGSLNQERVIDVSSLVGQAGSADDLVRMVERFDDAGLIVEARDVVVGSFSTIDEDSRAGADDLAGVRADLMYSVAVVASFYEREEDATGMYLATLAVDPGHAWACNDLGYRMIEDGAIGEELVEAIRLLVIAHEAEPDAASITDSLAWGRYRMGVFVDQVDAETGEVVQGARELLIEAIGMEDGDSNATIHDHLGDTHWMIGDYEKAIASWLDAEERLREQLTSLSTQENANQIVLENIRKELGAIRFKISDAESGRMPKVGSTARGIRVPTLSDDRE